MSYQLKEGAASNCLISLTIGGDVMADYKQKVLKEYQKDVSLPGFRKGHVPLSAVETQLKPEYIQMAIYEQVITDYLKKIVDEESKKNLIGAPYDIDFGEKDGQTVISFALDVYPTVTVANDGWSGLTLQKIDESVPQEEIDQAVYNFKKQYADYADADEITDATVTKVSYALLDKDGTEFDTSFLFVGDEEVADHPSLKDLFRGKKKDEVFDVPYNEKKIAAMLHYTKDKGIPATLKFAVGDIKKIVLPTLDDAKIKELFGDDAKVKNEEEIVMMISESMKQERVQAELMKQVEELLQSVMKDSLSVALPKTMIDEEVKQRMKNMQERLGGADKFDAYVKQLGEEKHQEMVKEISDAAKQSLEKFMILRKFVELHELDVNWETGLDAEKKLYKKLAGTELWVSTFLAEMNERA